MQKITSVLLTTLVAILVMLSAQATPVIEKQKAKNILIKTNRAIGVAHITIKKTRHYTGKLGQAVKHQRYAKQQYLAGNFESSIYHSRYARILAGEVMKENSAKPTSDFNFSAEENTLLANAPSDEQLTEELNKHDATILKDEDLLNGHLDIDIL
jgi:hypothetical protein